MKKYFLIPSPFCVLFFLTFNLSQSYSQTALNKKSSWSATLEDNKAFIENKGQFEMPFGKSIKANISYAVDEGQTLIYFTEKGITYYFRKKENKNKEEFNSNKSEHEREEEERKAKMITDIVNMEWLNINPAVTIVGEEKNAAYNNYTINSKEGQKNINSILGYKKIIYRNLYTNIDAEYIFHPDGGIKYSLILHPGADISQVKMKYSDTKNIEITNNGEIKISTLFGDITDHAPVTFYEGKKSENITSSFIKEGKTISFSLANYDKSKTVVIDPWTQTPTMTASNKVWECEKDINGNVYIIGGDSPMKLIKYNASGAIQWTYVTPYDTANSWLGTLVTDKAGNSYVTDGSSAAILKVNTNGGLVWSVNGGNYDEYWDIAFNCDETKLMVGGTRLGAFPPSGSNGVIFEINTNNGTLLGIKKVSYTVPHIISGMTVTDINEVRSLSSARNGKYYFLNLDSIGVINENLGSCNNAPPQSINSTYNFGYKCESYRVKGNSGIKAIKAGSDFLYTQNGTQVHKRSLADLSIISSTSILGGISSVNYGLYTVGNSGIDIDNCGNVYVGSGNGVIKHDADLNFIDSVKFNFAVYDVALSYNGDVIVCGASGNVGHIRSINMSGCNPMSLSCYDATICQAGPFCDIDSDIVNLSSITSGGIWSGPGITSANDGTFNTTVAGIGAHTIYYSVSGGVDSITILVNACVKLEVCKEANGNITVTNGLSPYLWEVYHSATNITVTDQATCQACGYIWNFGQCMNGFTPVTSCTGPAGWTTFATAATATPPSTSPIRVTDANGNSAAVTDVNALTTCVPLSVKEITQELQIGLHPNPTEGLFDVMLSNAKNVSAIRVIDALGRIVWEEKIVGNLSALNKKVDIKNQAKGIYFVQVFTGNGIRTTKISLD